MWNIELESKIVEHGRRKEKKELAVIRANLLKLHKEANYMLSRFLDEYGEQIDTDPKATELFKKFSSDYSGVERLLTILNAYDK